jgi:amino-acid N-acetyltransferase
MTKSSMRQHVNWFRNAAPYINAHRNKTFVLYLAGDAIAHENFENIINDITLLNSLGVRLVLVHGATLQIDERLASTGIESELHEGVRITTATALAPIEETIGRLRISIEARLSMGLVNSPMHGSAIRVNSGNFIKAKPLGVHHGIDFQHTGGVRKVHTSTINQLLETGTIVLVSPLGYSPSGEVFNLSACELATRVATELSANKMIYYLDQPGILDAEGNVINELQPSDAKALLAEHPSIGRELALAADACQNGVERCHLISYQEDGALLEELFTRDGTGTQICKESYEQIRQATIDDVAGIIELIRPLEEEGVLIKRSRELLEMEISFFHVIIRDGAVVGCAALYPSDDDSGELACLATHPDYRNSERGEALLKAVEYSAGMAQLRKIFVLTTQSAHWFQERGFIEESLDELPTSKQMLYNYQRNSRVFSKQLNN